MKRNKSVDARELFRLWNTTMSSQDIADKLGVGRTRLFILARRYGLQKRAMDSSTCKRIVDPSPEEIAERAAVVRSHWSEEELNKRACGAKRCRVEIQAFAMDPTSYSLVPMNH